MRYLGGFLIALAIGCGKSKVEQQSEPPPPPPPIATVPPVMAQNDPVPPAPPAPPPVPSVGDPRFDVSERAGPLILSNQFRAAKALLEPRIRSGKATEMEQRQYRMACKGLGDSSCSH